jgi:hypothetical protein
LSMPDRLPKVRPFLQEKQDYKPSTRGMLSIVTLLISLGTLTLALGGGAKLIFDVFDGGLVNSLAGIWPKIIALGIAYLFGWAIALLCIRAYCNLILPMFLKAYAWLCLAGIGVLYVKIIQKLYMQAYDAPRYWAYLFMMLGGMVVLVGLHLILEDHDLRPFAIPLLFIAMIQLFAIVYRYVFSVEANPAKLAGDLFFFIAMTAISALMLAHLGVLAPVRRRIDSWFAKANGASA